MKKVSALLLTTMLGSSMVFASFSGSASLELGANLDSGNFGMSNNSSVNFDINLLEQVNDATTSEEAIYAEINATLQVRVVNADEDGVPFTSPYSLSALVGASLDSAMVYGDNWSLDITGVTGGPDYAASTLESVTVEDEPDDWSFLKADYDDYYNYAPAYNDGVAGFSLTYGVTTVGFGFYHTEDVATDTNAAIQAGTDLTVYVGGDDYQLAEGLMFSGAVGYSQVERSATIDNYKAIAAGLKLAYTADDYSATVASDFGYDLDSKDTGADVAANVVFAPFTVDAYYATIASAEGTDDISDLLSVQVATDLSAFDMPLTVTLSGKDLVNAQSLEVVLAFTVSDNLTLTTTGDYTISTEAWLGQLEVEYVMEDVGTIDASVSFDTDSILAMSASIENTTLVDNATLSLAWADANDLLQKSVSVSPDVKEFGSITAKCEITF